MFKTYISDTVYEKIISTEERKATTARSYLYKLLKQQPVQLLKQPDTERYKAYPENVLKNPSALYILDITYAEALAPSPPSPNHSRAFLTTPPTATQ